MWPRMAIVRLILSSAVMVLGFVAFGVFLYFKNYPSAVGGIVTGVINLLLSHLHLLNLKRKLRDWYSFEQLSQISLLGFIAFALGISTFVYFTVIEIGDRKPILPVPDSAVLPMIWCFITLKSGAALCCYARWYRSNDDEAGLLSEEVRAEIGTV